MKSYVWITFAFMGWGYYELSGGSNFVPEERPVLIAEADIEQLPEVVTRNETTTLLAVSTSNLTPEPAVAARPAEAVIAPASAPVVEPQADETDVVPVVAPALVPELDIREVAGSRVNMRMGPGTNFDVITTLDGGTALEVLSVNDDGWANVLTVDLGIEGWMAERLLTDSAE